MGDFAIDLGLRHAAGSRRGERSQLAAMGVDRDSFMAEFGRAIDNLVGRYRDGLSDAFEVGSKMRWVDGTPEYSRHIFGLHKLFPEAKFVHIVREADAAVASMLNFHRLNGETIVADTAQAYAYWKTTVEACLAAERALGRDVVHRVRYADLVERPEHALTQILAFLGEPFQAQCCEPMRTRINSSQVPIDFAIDDFRVDPKLLHDTRELSESLQRPNFAVSPRDSAAAQGFERIFEERVDFVGALDGEYAIAQSEIARLQVELDRANAWASEGDATVRDRDVRIGQLQAEIECANAWALGRDTIVQRRDACIVQLQTELDASNRWALDGDATVRRNDVRIAHLQTELVEKTRWASRLDRLLGGFGMLPIVQCVFFALSYLADRIGLRNMHAFMHVAMFTSSAGGAMAFAWMRRAQVFAAARDADGIVEFFRFLLQ